MKEIFYKSFYTDKEKGLTRILILGIFIVLFIWASTFLWNWLNLYDKPGFNGGTLGDSFGMVNALFTSLAFALLIYTALMQKEELKLQRKELEENRAELKRSADAHLELVQLTTKQLDLTIKQLQISKESYDATLNLNLDSLSPQLEIIEQGIEEGWAILSMKVKFRELTPTEVVDSDENSISKEDVYFSYQRHPTQNNVDPRELILPPNDVFELYIKDHCETLFIYFENIDGKAFSQEIVKKQEIYSIHLPIKG